MATMTDRSPLGQLYDTVIAVNGWAMRDVARRAEDRGVRISKSRIGQLVNSWPLPSISIDMIDALSLGLGVSRDRIALAAVQSMGFQIANDSLTPAEVISRDESLSADTKAALIAILRAQRKPQRGDVAG